ncbi:MAG TPA: hypothetical protein VM241_07835 [Candidatus Thermoplasmatota archaeon]|nr:hypothetical protein [Candidatus Thermoplasmatota archaeon]
MPPSSHRPEWPDKAMFAALCLILGGGLGLLFEVGRGLLFVNQDALYLFTSDIPFYTLACTAATLLLGIACLRTQAALYGYLGAAAALLSLALFGLVSFLGAAAVAFLVKAHLEGEETRNDGIRLSAEQWPDKALAAAMVLFVGGALTLAQAFAVLFNSYRPVLVTGVAATGLDAVAGLAALWAARETYHLRRPWAGAAAAVLLVAAAATYVLGPALGVAALVLLSLARREGEFHPEPAVRAELQAERRARKAAT